MSVSQQSTFTVFISHRHQDAKIAEVVHDVLSNTWLRGTSAEIYMSSLPGAGRPGADLTNFLKDKLKRTDLFLLVFTQADEDWSYCMWELGVVSGTETKPTQIIVLNCSTAEPRVRIADLSINARDEASIRNFAKPFFSEPNWLIKDESTRKAASDLIQTLSEINEEGIKRRSAELHKKLMGVIPQGEPVWQERLQHLQLTLEPEDVRCVKSFRDQAEQVEHSDPQRYNDLRESAKTVIRRKARVPTKSSQSCLERFGLDRAQSDTVLDHLLSSWDREFRRIFRNIDDSSKRWIDDLLTDLSRATVGRISVPSPFTMPSIKAGDQSELVPVVVRTRQRLDEGIDFFIYFFKVPEMPDDDGSVELINS